MSNKKVLILGGAGFIGSNLVQRFIDHGCNVTVIDGLLEKTGGRAEHLSSVFHKMTFIEARIEAVKNLPDILSKQDVIVDAMAWTSHLAALKDPFYDLELNVKSHLYFLEELRKSSVKPGKIIYLGSRSQYGNPRGDLIDEAAPMEPQDIQGTHKLAAENYYRIYSKLHGLNVISLRIPNCFGENQPVEGNDIGLVGGFIRDSLENKIVEIYGKDRKRNLVYVKDLAGMVEGLSDFSCSGFLALNIAGYESSIEDLVKTIIRITAKGRFVFKEIPQEIKHIDAGSARYDDGKLKNILKNMDLTDFNEAIEGTVKYFEGKRMYDLEV